MKLVTVKLPDDLEQKLAEIKGERSINAVIVEALRAQWFPVAFNDRKFSPKCGEQQFSESGTAIWGSEPAKFEAMMDSPHSISGEPYPPVWGSIPAERKDA